MMLMDQTRQDLRRRKNDDEMPGRTRSSSSLAVKKSCTGELACGEDRSETGNLIFMKINNNNEV